MYVQDKPPAAIAASTDAPRRCRLTIEPIFALRRLGPDVEALARRAVEPNPFFLPDFLGAAAAFAPPRLWLACLWWGDRLVLFAPVVMPLRPSAWRAAAVWTHPYAPLGSPLVDREAAATWCQAFIAALAEHGVQRLGLPDMPLRGSLAEALRSAAKASGRHVLTAAAADRPILDVAGSRRAGNRPLPAKKRQKEMARQLRRLAELGGVGFTTAQGRDAVTGAFAVFAELEAAGWKGRRGTALGRRADAFAFAEQAIVALAASGHAEIDLMQVGGAPVAALVRLRCGALAVPWKIAYDERYAAYSPGKQLMQRATEAWRGEATLDRVDPVCEEGNPMLSVLWPGTEPYGALTVAAPGAPLAAARLQAALADAGARLRRSARLLRRQVGRIASRRR